MGKWVLMNWFFFSSPRCFLCRELIDPLNLEPWGLARQDLLSPAEQAHATIRSWLEERLHQAVGCVVWDDATRMECSNALALPAPDNSHLDSILPFTKGFCISHPTGCSQPFLDKVAQKAGACHVSPSDSQQSLAFTLVLILEFTLLFEPLGNCWYFSQCL